MPQQHIPGGKPHLLGIGKRGNRYLRTLLIHGTWAILTPVHRDTLPFDLLDD